MSIDLDDIKGRISDGIYGDDRMTAIERDDAFSALAEIIAEVQRLRGEPDRERAAVVTLLRKRQYETRFTNGSRLSEIAAAIGRIADSIERGEHRSEVT